VKKLQPAQQLLRQHEDCFEVEAAATVVEKIFQAGSKKVEDHDIVVAFDTEPPHIRDADCSSKTVLVQWYHDMATAADLLPP
jgi:hypothetical protein